MQSTLKKLPDSKIRLEVGLNKEELSEYLNEAEKNLANELRLEGFRPGKVPKEFARKHLGEAKIKEEALSIALRSSFIEVVKKEKLDVIDQTDFKIIENSPEVLKYTMVLSVFPEVELGKYTGLEVEKKPVSINEAEVETTLTELAKMRTPSVEAGKEEGKEEKPAPPEINDDFARSLGKFKSLADLKENLRQSLLIEKENKEKDRLRLEILGKIVESSKFEMPKALVEERVDLMIRDFDAELHQKGMELGLYLAHLKKTQDDLRKDWQPKAESQVKMSLVARALARKEKLAVEDGEVDREFAVLADQYTRQGMIEELQKADPESIKSRIKDILLNEKVFEFLEKNNAIE